MYFVNREQIEKTLQYMEEHLQIFLEQKQWETKMERLALERIIHTLIESVLDVGNMMIDGFIMRDPGSYEDIIDILMDEKVVTTEQGVQLKKFILLRKGLVQYYTTAHELSVIETVDETMDVLNQFPKSVRYYLQNELGPVSAFSSEGVK